MAKGQPKPSADTAEAPAPVAGNEVPAKPQDATAPEAAGERSETVEEPKTPTPPDPVEVEHCDVRVLAEVTIADVRFLPNTVIEGLPTGLARAHKDSVDVHPEAVAYARSIDAPVVRFEPTLE